MRPKVPHDLSELGEIFIGLDPALKSDYYGIAANVVDLNRPESEHPAKLLYLDRLRGGLYTEINEVIDKTLNVFENFTKITIDYTNNQSLGDIYEDRFGKDRVVKVRFTPGESGTKMQMMQQLAHAWDTRYRLPDLSTIHDPTFKADVIELCNQALHEVVRYNRNGSVSFDHKGPHNDLLHAELLSMYSAQTWIDLNKGKDGSHVGGETGYAYPIDTLRDLAQNALGGSIWRP